MRTNKTKKQPNKEKEEYLYIRAKQRINFRIRVLERYIVSSSRSSSDAIWTTMNLGYIYVLYYYFLLQEFNIEMVLLLMLFSCFIIIFGCCCCCWCCQPIPSSSFIFFFIVAAVLSCLVFRFSLLLWLSFGMFWLFVFYWCFVLFAPAIFIRLIYDEHKKAQNGKMFTQIDRCFPFQFCSYCSRNSLVELTMSDQTFNFSTIFVLNLVRPHRFRFFLFCYKGPIIPSHAAVILQCCQYSVSFTMAVDGAPVNFANESSHHQR